MADDWQEAGSLSGAVWQPENEGDQIIGEYIQRKENVGVNNSKQYILQVDGEEEPTTVWGSTVLDTKFSEVPLYAQVKIVYQGKVKGKAPQPYKDYKVFYKATEKSKVNNVFPGAEAA